MLNTLVSGHLVLPTLPDNQLSHLNSIMNRADSSMSETVEGAVEPVNSHLISSGNFHEQSEFVHNNMQPNSGQSELLTRSKRKAMTEPLPDNWGLQKTNSFKRVASGGSNAKAPSVSPAPNKKSMPNTRSSAPGKKVLHLESFVSKSPPTVSKKYAQPEVSPQSQGEMYDSVRAKLRESLASALALVSQQREGSSDGKTNELEPNAQEGRKEHNLLVCESSAGAADTGVVKIEESGTSSILIDGCNYDKKASPGFHSSETCREDTETWNYMGTEFQSNAILSGEDSLFSDGLFFKDELLQGNGLSWVSDPNPHISELKLGGNAITSEMMHEDKSGDEMEKTIRSPESVALEIESELFKLYGGVNKKYKEKGRSLLFNLKDRNNPELRERVMSGEIPPDCLCSMTAEELASKELSEWRIAKAEELDHMKVLPDSDGNMRRLVKKTHKGEYQVDLDPDMGAPEEISPSISVHSEMCSKVNDSDAGPPYESKLAKVEQYDQCEITIPSDGTDMQGLMVYDVKDLPPIVSLDEFMESLNKEPPFENLPVDSGTTNLETDKENPEVCSESRSPIQPSKEPVASQKTEDVGVESKFTDKKIADAQKGLDTKTICLPKQEHVWEGLLQLNLSSMANFVALYISGEKANTREWAGFFDIKGRVRLDAFDKFLQALPMSRSRAIMVSHFVLKDGSTDSERSDLVELVDSYITDERLGFAEPAPGVELYLCPPRTKTVDMIINHLPKSYTEKLNNIDDGLIGIVVWRKVQITPSVISPNLSHQRHMNKNHIGGQKSVNDDMNRNNPGYVPRPGPSPPILSKPPQLDEDDDVPPGFGPPGQREEDDLPEFNFSGGPNVPTSVSNPNLVPSHGMGSRHHNLLRASARQVDQMRELIQKYGQNETSGGGGIATEPWIDDDDDIPEWQPQAPHIAPLPPPPQPIQNHTLAPHMACYPSFQRPPWPPVPQPIQPLQPPMSVQQQGTWWPYGTNSVGSLKSGQFDGGSGSGYLARDWRSNNCGNNKGF